MFLYQSGFVDLRSTIPNWNGPLIDLGSFDDTVTGHRTRRRIVLSLHLADPADGGRFPLELEVTLSRGRNPLGHLSTMRLKDVSSEIEFEMRRRRGRLSSYDCRIAGETVAEVQTAAPGARYTRGSRRFYSPRVGWAVDSMLDQARGSTRVKSIRGGVAALKRIRAHIDSLAYLPGSMMQRVTSGRAVPMRLYPRPAVDDVGRDSAAESIFAEVSPSQLLLGDSSPRRGRFREWRHAFLSDLLRELDIATEIEVKDASPYHTTIRVRDSRTRTWANLVDVGYGASQVIPVALACLATSRAPLYVEQPEIHLHPRAQAAVAQLLCAASMNRQVLVETHSVHLINATRILLAEGVLSPKHVRVIYVRRERTGSHVTEIQMDKQGDFLQAWPDGFFDQRYNDTMALARLANE
jgi:hypothetical protein